MKNEFLDPEDCEFLNPHFREEKHDINLNKDIGFNTCLYWWCWYNVEKNIIINQYSRIVNRNAKEYLIGIGLMDENLNILSNFEEESNEKQKPD